MVNYNNIFSFKFDVGFMPNVLMPRIRRKTKSAFVHQENIAPLLVSTVCVLTALSISIAFWDEWNAFLRFAGIQTNFISNIWILFAMKLSYWFLCWNFFSYQAVKCWFLFSVATINWSICAVFCVVYHCFNSWNLSNFRVLFPWASENPNFFPIPV